MNHSPEQLRTLIESEWKNQATLIQCVITQGLSPAPTLKKLLPSFPSSSGQPLPPGVLPEAEEPIIRRFRPPFDNTNKHDARGDGEYASASLV